MSVTDGGPAFPLRASGHVDEPRGSADQNLTFTLSGGMSLRDYFAAQALSGFIATLPTVTNPREKWPAMLASDAYLLADEMLKARAKPVPA